MSDIPERNDLATRLARLEKMVNDLTRLTVLGAGGVALEPNTEVNAEIPPAATKED